MPEVHRVGDLRECLAITLESGNGAEVYVENQLWAVEGDPNDHTGGELRSVVGSTVFINNLKVIVKGDQANADLLHPEPETWVTGPPATFASSVFCYG